MRDAVFLDRDGTVIEDRHYLADPAGVALCPGAAEGLRRMQAAGVALVVVTNQSGLARGYFDWPAYHAVADRLAAVLAAEGVTLAGTFVCPHGPEDDCACRKPRPGLIHQAQATLGVRPVAVIGDKAADVALGQAVGVPGLLVRTGKGAATEAAGTVVPDGVYDTLASAARGLVP